MALAALILSSVSLFAGAFAGIAFASAGAAPESHGPRHKPSSSAEKAGDRGFRAAERVLAELVDIRRTQGEYLKRVAEPAQRESCRATRRCTYDRQFDISFGARSKVALLFSLDLSDVGDIACDRARADNGCDISAILYAAGDEAFPHCVSVAPLHRAAASHGWRKYPFRDPGDRKVFRYRHSDDSNTFLFIRTLGDYRCFHNIYVARIPPLQDSIRN
ncbi:MAG: hypothetical protein ABWX67_15065 [Allosphingosinicella sp.]